MLPGMMPFGGLTRRRAPLDPPETAYANSGGMGDRTASITVASNAAITSAPVSNLVDGATGTNATDSVDFTGDATINVGDYIRFDFGVGVKKYIDEFRAIVRGTYDYGAWELQGSNDASEWTTLLSDTWAASGNPSTFTSSAFDTLPPPQGYRYYQWIKITDTDAWGFLWHSEFEFKIASGAT